MVYLAVYKGKGLIGNAITRLWTRSKYSHCELVINGLCYSASFMDGGVRVKQINIRNGKWDLIPMPWANEQEILDFFEATKGQKYDWFGIIGSQLFNRRHQSNHKYFCSEWCAAAPKLPTPEIHSPHTLAQFCLFLLKWGLK